MERAAEAHRALAELGASRCRALEGLAWIAVSDRCLADFKRDLASLLHSGPPFDTNRLVRLARVTHSGTEVFGGNPVRSVPGWSFDQRGSAVTCDAGATYPVTVSGHRVFGFDLEWNLFDSLEEGRLDEAGVVQRRVLAARAELDGVAARLEQHLLTLGLKEAGLRAELDQLDQADRAGEETLWEETALEAVRGYIRGSIQPSLARFLQLDDEV